MTIPLATEFLTKFINGNILNGVPHCWKEILFNSSEFVNMDHE